jgi:uncharacterized membrane protein YedE/YeeE
VLFWVLFGVLAGAAGIAVLGLLTLRLWRQVRQLGREVAVAGERIARASDELQRVTPPR